MDDMIFSFKVETPPAWIPIGRTAENDWRTIEIDCSYWFNMDATGNVVLMYRPSCNMSPYPLLTERDGDSIIWRPKSGELVEGVGRLQAFFEVGTDVIGSSDMISCEVDSSLLGVDPGIDPGQTDLPWALDIIEQIAELSGHYPKIVNGVLFVWDSNSGEWVQFQGGGSGSSTVIVTIDDTTDPMTASMTAAEIKAAADQGERVVLSFGGFEIPYLTYFGQTAVFSIVVDVDSPAPVYMTLFIAQNGRVTATSTPLARRADVPTTEQMAAAAPVQSVNGQTGAVTIPIPTVPQMATQADMSDWTSGKTVDAATLKDDLEIALALMDNIESNKADKTEIPSLTGYATETWVEGKGYQTAAQVQSAIAGVRQLPTVTASDNGKFLRVVNGAWAAATVQTWQGGSY